MACGLNWREDFLGVCDRDGSHKHVCDFSLLSYNFFVLRINVNEY